MRNEGKRYGSKTLHGFFIGYDQRAGGSWSGDLFVVDWDEMENADMASSVLVKRVAAKEVVTQRNVTFPLAEGSCRQPATRTSDRAQLRGGRRRSKPFRSEPDLEEEEEGVPRGSQLFSNDEGEARASQVEPEE